MNSTDLVDRINNYLALGGLFNPELMDATEVRELLIDCRNFIQESKNDQTNTDSSIVD